MHGTSGTSFRRSTFCADSGCVEVRTRDDGSIAVRDSKNLDIPQHVFTPDEWTAFVLGVKAGEFDFGITNTASEIQSGT